MLILPIKKKKLYSNYNATNGIIGILHFDIIV